MRPTEFREFWEFTVEKVAVNAVMAGRATGIFPGDPRARSERHHRAFEQHHLDGQFRRRQRSDPPRDRHEFRHRRARPLQPRQQHDRPRLRPLVAEPPGRLGAGRNLHGHRSAIPLAYAGCFAENEERSPWEPLHVRRASSRNDSAVSVFFGARYTHSGYGPRETWQEQFRRALPPSSAWPPLLVLDPIVARGFVARGIATQADADRMVRRPMRACPPANIGTTSGSRRCCGRSRSPGSSPMPPASRPSPTSIIQIFEPGEINVVVTGGETQGAWKMIGARYQRTVSIDAWR